MTTVGFERRCSHAFCDEAFQLGLNSFVLGSHDVPAWLRFPRGSFNFLVKEVSNRGSLCCPDKVLFMLGQIASKGRNTVLLQPHSSVRHFYMREDVRGRELFLQLLCCLIVIWGECSEVDECGDTGVRSSGCDDGTTIGVTDQDCRRADSTEGSFDASDISSVRVQTVLGSDNLEAFFLQRRDQLGVA